jgi:hypothetical protein
MKKYLIGALAGALIASGGFAQADTGSHNPAVKNSKAHTTQMAANGRNSFTESQAKGRIAKAGYSDITPLVKNPNGVWQGKATKDGATVNVALDYKGNVTVH